MKFYGAFQSPSTLFLVSEFFEGGDLLGLLQKQHGRGMAKDKVVFYCSEVLSALVGLHDMGIVYRDLKPENILVSGDGHLALTDFGTATVAESVNDLAGTLSYMAPECVMVGDHDQDSYDGPGYGRAVDMWSLGVMMYEMLVGRLPFTTPNNDTRTKHRILKGAATMTKLHSGDLEGTGAFELVEMLLNRDVDQRIDAAGAQNHAFFCLPDEDSGVLVPIDWARVAEMGYTAPWVPSGRSRIPTLPVGEDMAEKAARETAELQALVKDYPEDLGIYDTAALGPAGESVNWGIDEDVR